jgi:hypothetical protein
MGRDLFGPPEKGDALRVDEIIETARARYREAVEGHRRDWEEWTRVQEFLAGRQWPEAVVRERGDRPALVLDHLNQYVRHVVNSGLLHMRDIRVLAMDGEADEVVADVVAGLIRQIGQTSSARVAYETGLRHACQLGCGYWRVVVQPIRTTGLWECAVRRIRDPRMVVMDPNAEYPDGRDAAYMFVVTQMSRAAFREQYPNVESVTPWEHPVYQDSMSVAEYYWRTEDGTVRWAICTGDTVIQSGRQIGEVMPIIRVVGEEYEERGQIRYRGMISTSAMDAQRAYNYAASAFIEAVALAPLAPFVAAEGQVESYLREWADAHRVPRAVLRYTPKTISGQQVPPPQRAPLPGIPEGWQAVMQNLIADTQMIMGLAQPSVLGTGGAPVQSGAGIVAQQEPGAVNTYHYIEHWFQAIEQTGRAILSMIPHVYTTPQVIRIVGDDGIGRMVWIDPTAAQAVAERVDAYRRVLMPAYNPAIGRYDVMMSTGPTSVTKRQEANRAMQTIVNAYPDIMKIAGDLVVGTMDVPGADVLAKRLRAMLPKGLEDGSGIQELNDQLAQLTVERDNLQKLLLAEREKAQARLIEVQLKAEQELAKQRIETERRLAEQAVQHEHEMRLAVLKVQMEQEKSEQQAATKLAVAAIKQGGV